MLMAQTKEVNDILLFKFRQHGRRDVQVINKEIHACNMLFVDEIAAMHVKNRAV